MSSPPCPNGGQFYACLNFVGCCTTKTCHGLDRCPKDNLRPASFNAKYYKDFYCSEGSNFVICENTSSTFSSFMGCCKSNSDSFMCPFGCPQANLAPGRLLSFPNIAAAATSNTSMIDSPSLPSTTASISQKINSLGALFPLSFPKSPVQSQSTPTMSSSSSSRPALPSQSTATAVNFSSSTHAQSSSGGPGETSKLIIGLAVTIAVSILLATIGLAYFYNMRKRRRRKDHPANPHHDARESEGEEENSLLYFQQKAELDAEQRRHEMAAIEVRYELEGDFEIRGMPA